MGDSPEREWAAAMAESVEEKLPRAMADGFAHHAVNWLIVYDNWPLPHINFAKAVSFLSPLLEGMNAFSLFDVLAPVEN